MTLSPKLLLVVSHFRSLLYSKIQNFYPEAFCPIRNRILGVGAENVSGGLRYKNRPKKRNYSYNGTYLENCSMDFNIFWHNNASLLDLRKKGKIFKIGRFEFFLFQCFWQIFTFFNFLKEHQK